MKVSRKSNKKTVKNVSLENLSYIETLNNITTPQGNIFDQVNE